MSSLPSFWRRSFKEMDATTRLNPSPTACTTFPLRMVVHIIDIVQEVLLARLDAACLECANLYLVTIFQMTRMNEIDSTCNTNC
jgi:hypothetical protein